MFMHFGRLICVGPTPVQGPQSAAELRERWRQISQATVWLHPSDWYHPGVDALVWAIITGRGISAAAERLAHARALGGVGIGETIDDIGCLYQAAGGAPSAEILRVVATGWVATVQEWAVRPAVHDPVSGLGTTQYLIERLAEVYGNAARSLVAAGDRYALLVIDASRAHGIDPAEVAVVGQALMAVFGVGHPMATLGNGVYVVLTDADPGPCVSEEVRATITRVAESHGIEALAPQTRVAPLPATHRQVITLLADLRRAG